MKKTLVNGVEGAGVPADDLGLLQGWSVFETLRTYGDRTFRYDAHMARLAQSARLAQLPAPHRATLDAEVAQVLAPDHVIRITLTGSGHRIVSSKPVDPSYAGRPITMGVAEMPPPKWLSGLVKHGNRMAWTLAAQTLKVQEIMIVDTHGAVLEANRSNIIAVIDGELITPPVDGRSLDGITRGAMLDAADTAGIPLKEAPFKHDAPFEELYACSSLKELSPVATLDGTPVGGGPRGDALYRAFKALRDDTLDP